MREQVTGKTGIVGVDGILGPAEAEKLNTIQESAARTVFGAIRTRQPHELFPLAGMSTGIGKGNVIHRIIERQMRLKPDSKVLLIAGTKTTLVDQSHFALAEYQSGEYITAEDDERIIDEDIPPDNPLADQQSLLYKTGTYGFGGDVNVEIATVQKVMFEASRDTLDVDSYDLVIVDEVHNIGTVKRKRMIQRFKNVAGFTATPHRHSGEYKKPEEYGFKQVFSYTLPEAQADRLSPPLLGMQISTADIIDQIPTNAFGKIKYRQLERMLKAHPGLQQFIVDRLVPIITSPEGGNYKTIVAVNFVWEAEKIAKLLAEKGIKVGLAVNKTAAKQIHTDEIPALDAISRFQLPDHKPNALQVLVSPYVAGEGFDVPPTEVVAWASATDSDLRYTQYNGRLARRAPGKKYGLVIDFLYQTPQFGWSYNMGMWMKGDVVQLDNGMLYMGPPDTIANIEQSSSMRTLESLGDRTRLAELQEEILRVQEGEIVLSENGLRQMFIGDKSRLMRISSSIVKELKRDHPEFFAIRVTGTNNVEVVKKVGRAIYVERMEDKDVDVRPVQGETEEVKDTDIVGSVKGLSERYVGDQIEVYHAGKRILAEMEAERPEDVADRVKNSTPVRVITGSGTTIFDRRMEEAGFRLRDPEIKVVQETDYTLTIKGSVEKRFVGTYRGDRPLKLMVEQVEEEHPEWFDERKRKSGKGPYIKTVKDEHREDFEEAMIAKGAQFRE